SKVARAFVAFTVKQTYGVEIRSFAFSQLWCVFELGDYGATGSEILLGPEWVVVCHRFAPVAHREIRLDLRRLTKRLKRLLVPERMQGRESAQKMRLRLR